MAFVVLDHTLVGRTLWVSRSYGDCTESQMRPKCMDVGRRSCFGDTLLALFPPRKHSFRMMYSGVRMCRLKRDFAGLSDAKSLYGVLTVTDIQADSSQLSFGLITDIHHASFDYDERHCSKSLGRLRRALDWMEKRGIRLLINLGDSINCGYGNNKEAEYTREVRSALTAFPGQVKFLIGNHDIETFPKAEFLDLLQCGQPCAFEEQGVRCILLDGNNHADGSDFMPGNFTWDQAHLGPGQRALLEDELKKAAGKPVLIFCHECLDHSICNGEPDPHLVKDFAEARAIINRFPNVLAVIQGHYHPGRSMVVDGLPYLAMASIVGDDEPDPGAAAIVHVMKDGSLEIEGFGRQPSLKLSRNG